MKNKKIIALGELLIDKDNLEDGSNINLIGGAPLNFICAARKWIKDCYYITGLTNDLKDYNFDKIIKKEHINLAYSKLIDNLDVAYTKVDIDKNTGERQFSFNLNNAPFLNLSSNDLKEEYFSNLSLLHIGTVALLNDNYIKLQTLACTYAKKYNSLISFDPNFRDKLFNRNQQIALTKLFLPLIDILKVSEEELGFLITDKEKNDEKIQSLFDQFENIKIILLTKGKKGLELHLKNSIVLYQPGIKPKQIIDTIGCGDITFGTFIGSLLYLNKENYDIDKLKLNIYEEALLYAAIAGSLTCEHQGALPTPTKLMLQSQKEKAQKDTIYNLKGLIK